MASKIIDGINTDEEKSSNDKSIEPDDLKKKEIRKTIDGDEQKCDDVNEIIDDGLDKEKEEKEEEEEEEDEDEEEEGAGGYATPRWDGSPSQEDGANEADDDIRAINDNMDEVFQQRVAELQEKAPNDLELQIRTYQEWVESLSKRNEAVMETMKSLKESLKDCMDLPPVVPETHMKLIRDRETLVKCVQKAFHSNGVWNFDGLKLEAKSLDKFLKKSLEKPPNESSSSKMPSSSTGGKPKRKKSIFTKTKSDN